MKSQYIKSARHACRRFAVLSAATLLLAGCEALTLDREPEVAYVELDSPDVSRITLVTSQWFIEVEDPDCEIPGDPGCPRRIQLVEADTNSVSLPFEESYAFDFRLQFYAEAFTDPPVEASVSMRCTWPRGMVHDSVFSAMNAMVSRNKMTFQYSTTFVSSRRVIEEERAAPTSSWRRVASLHWPLVALGLPPQTPFAEPNLACAADLTVETDGVCQGQGSVHQPSRQKEGLWSLFNQHRLAALP